MGIDSTTQQEKPNYINIHTNKVFASWYHNNLVRAFPLQANAQLCKNIPSQLFADIVMLFPPDFQDTCYCYIQQILPTAQSFTVYFGIATTGTSNYSAISKFAVIRDVPNTITQAGIQDKVLAKDNPNYRAISLVDGVLENNSWLTDFQGYAVFGNTSCIGSLPVTGITASNAQHGMLDYRCMQRSTQYVRSIQVNGQQLTGDIQIAGGNYVQLGVTPATAQSKCTITVSLTATAKQNLKAAVLALLGQPVMKINGVSPSSDGNIYLQGLDCVQVKPSGSSILINNPCSKPCCQQSVSSLQSRINTLDSQKQQLLNYYRSLSSNINTMASQLSTLIAQVQ